jgi:hypothetical protein
VAGGAHVGDDGLDGHFCGWDWVPGKWMDGEVALFLLGSQLWGRSDDVVDDRNTVRSESMVED